MLQKIFDIHNQLIDFNVFLATESEVDNHFSPTRLDLAVQEVDNFAFLYKIEKTRQVYSGPRVVKFISAVRK